MKKGLNNEQVLEITLLQNDKELRSYYIQNNDVLSYKKPSREN